MATTVVRALAGWLLVTGAVGGCSILHEASTASVTGPAIVCPDEAAGTTRPAGPHAASLTCENAVAAASKVHPNLAMVTRIEFSFGVWCPSPNVCPTVPPDAGFVAFYSCKGRLCDAPDIVVPVTVDTTGQVETGEPQVISSTPKSSP